ncbi:MAG: hypothetical protein MZV49_12085, partial [Rhodopseudomonas palustris]|nr:hypothetical protein [Rhodopseudomonas palustris]
VLLRPTQRHRQPQHLTQFFSKNPSPRMAALQDRLKAGLSGNPADGAGNRPEPAAAAALGVPHPLPLDRRLRHHRLGQAAHRHSGRRARTCARSPRRSTARKRAARRPTATSPCRRSR